MSYFKPLRRKLGVVTLLLACAFMCGWVRSLTRYEMLILDKKGILISHSGTIQLTQSVRVRYSQPKGKIAEGWLEPSTYGAGLWKFSSSNTGSAKLNAHAPYTATYWSIVIPLTLFSAWLLLSKPCKKPSQVPA